MVASVLPLLKSLPGPRQEVQEPSGASPIRPTRAQAWEPALADFSQTYCRSDLQIALDWHTVPLSTLTPTEVIKEAERSARAGLPALQILCTATKDAEEHLGA